jgi:crotonobetainyl-CoA:carnitine CoA-transferase CaiB-like acyl-CoA transferase
VAEQPFAGVTVIEFGQFVAVPYCGQLLADGGALVIKVEPLEGEPSRHIAPLMPGEARHFLSRNRGKHSLPIELRHPFAHEVFNALFAKADVALFNLRPGLAAELGLEAAGLRATHPRLITGTVTPFGRTGPDAALAGMDYVVQARSGLMAAMGKLSDEGLPAAGDSPISDYMCAALLAFAVGGALYRRERTGEGGEIDITLLGSAMALQNTLFTRVHEHDQARDNEYRAWLREARAEGRPFPEQIAHNPAARPSSLANVYYRTYATKDSAVAIACASPGLQQKLQQVTGIRDALAGKTLGRPADEVIEHYLGLQGEMEARFRERSTTEWQAAFNAVGIPASPVYLPLELLTDPQVEANGLVYTDDHWALGPVTNMAPPVQLDGDAFRPGPAVAPIGSETGGLLRWAGLDGDAVTRLTASGAVRAAS